MSNRVAKKGAAAPPLVPKAAKEEGGEILPPRGEKPPGIFHSEKKVKKVKDQGIMVTALREGTYRNDRKVEGDQFMIEHQNHLGSWMQCHDPVMASAHKGLMKQRRAEGLAIKKAKEEAELEGE